MDNNPINSGHAPQERPVTHVLIIEDDQTFLMLVKCMLQRDSSTYYEVYGAETLADGLKIISSRKVDVLLLDLTLPDSTGIESVRRIKSHAPDLPVVVVTSNNKSETAREALRRGAQDYLVKGEIDLKILPRVINYALERSIGERKRKLAEEKYRTVFNYSPVGITVTDEKERIISWNPFAERLLGMDHQDLYLRPVSSLYSKEEWKRIRSMDIRKKGSQENLETKIIQKNGQLRDIELSITILKDDADKIVGSIGIMQDITERRKVEQAEREKESVEMKSKFVSMVSHELRTPIAAIKGNLSNVLSEAAGALNEVQKDFLETCDRNLDRLARLINEVLDFQKIKSGKLELHYAEYDLNQIVEEVKKMHECLAERKALQVELKLDPELPKMCFDKDRISEVLVNLLSNAIKFTDKGTITMATMKNDTSVKIWVEDQGIGLKKEDLPKLFKSFSQVQQGDFRRPGSSGLGLVITKEIVELHKGQIWVESEYEKGSTFFFTLPMVKPGMVVPHKQILIVDDEPDLLKSMTFSLKNKGYHVITAENGRTAYEMLKDKRPDLTFLDFRLPDMSGLDILKAVKNDEMLKGMPIVITTADANPDVKRQFDSEHADGYLIKPFDPDALLAQVSKFLR